MSDKKCVANIDSPKAKGSELLGNAGFKHKPQPKGHPIGTGGRAAHHRDTSFGGSGHRVGSRRK